jgi:hypothetical protein
VQLFSEFKAGNQQDYDLCIPMQHGFVQHILSLPTINCYLVPLIKSGLKLDFKLLYQSYYFQVSEEEEKSVARGDVLVETSKDERKMFVFANSFELLHSLIVHQLNAFELFPVL